MTVLRCAYLTMDQEPDWAVDNELAFAPMQALGWQVDALPWRREDVDWQQFNAVYIGTPWDYPEDPQRFMRLLESIDRSPAVLVNDIDLVRWTMAKTYLRDLESRGVRIVPSCWGDEMSRAFLTHAFERFDAQAIIVKPVISTNATDTFMLTRDSLDTSADELSACFAARSFVVQPFIERIRTEGEFSLFYFGGEFSHAIRKTPRHGDFRVQEQFGAAIETIDAHDALLAAGQSVLRVVAPQPVYARCDFVPGDDGELLLMELELIEPSLYLGMDDAAPVRFARAFDACIRSKMRETRSDPQD